MKKAPTKLALRRETLRALDGLQLRRALGGFAAADSGAAMCPGDAVWQPPPIR